MENKKVTFSFYGISLIVEAPAETARQLQLDFSYFMVPSLPEAPLLSIIRIVAHGNSPVGGFIPPLTASMSLADGVVYDRDNIRYVDYNGKAVVRYDYHAESGELYSGDPSLLHELLYLLIHSRVGELLDRRGFHRVHALGIAVAGRGILCLLPQGGGKTTLFLELMKNPATMILSDDTPLIDRGGMLFPFPVRVGVAEEKVPSHIPSAAVTIFHRRNHGSKALIDISFFSEKISNPIRPRFLFIGKRVNAATADIKPASILYAAGALLSQCVIGLGLPQVVEYFLRRDPRDGVRKCVIVLSRLYAAGRLLLRTRHYCIYLGTDAARNSACLMKFIENKCAKGQ